MLHPKTLEFLTGLAENNTKEWFESNRKKYDDIRKSLVDFVNELTEEMTSFDPALKGLQAKDCLFRINRDVRFSPNKQPYKTNMGASMSPGGRNSMKPGYYLHLQPGGAFLAGGLYMPMPAQLAAIRQEIDYNVDEFKGILTGKDFKQYFGQLGDFDKLKTAPKGYPKDHPELELLKLKSYIVSHPMKDAQIFDKDFMKYCVKVFKAMYPLDQFLNRAIDI